MEINTTGIIVAKQRFGETSNIITLFTESRGILKGLLKGASTKKDQYALQLGNIVDVNWKARLENHLGLLKLNLKSSALPYIFSDQLKLLTLNTICELTSKFFAEGDNHFDLYETTTNLITTLKLDDFFIYYIKWELILLRSIGYGLDFSVCGVCNKAEEVNYVSPKSGISVCEKIGFPHNDKLLKLPTFLINNNGLLAINNFEKQQAFNLTNYFINRFCNAYNCKLSNTRANLIEQFCS